MLLSAFAYAHFVNIADPEARKQLSGEADQASKVLGAFEYKAGEFFGDSSAVLTDFARAEISEILSGQEKQLLTIYVPAVSQTQDGQRLRQWEKVAARSAAIADAFQKAGQDGDMIVLKMPDKLVSAAAEKQNIILTFLPPETTSSDK